MFYNNGHLLHWLVSRVCNIRDIPKSKNSPLLQQNSATSNCPSFFVQRGQDVLQLHKKHDVQNFFCPLILKIDCKNNLVTNPCHIKPSPNISGKRSMFLHVCHVVHLQNATSNHDTQTVLSFQCASCSAMGSMDTISRLATRIWDIKEHPPIDFIKKGPWLAVEIATSTPPSPCSTTEFAASS